MVPKNKITGNREILQEGNNKIEPKDITEMVKKRGKWTEHNEITSKITQNRGSMR